MPRDAANIEIPNNWAVRDYQQPAWDALTTGGKKRAVIVWPRRAGKDSLSLNYTALMSQLRVGTVWHMAPTQRQVRKIVWQGIDKAGRRMIDQAFPPEIRKTTRDQEMTIELKNGSIWQCVGSDSYDNLVGTNVVGVVFSEYSLSDPAAWNFIRPILAENGGWAIFIYTPRGANHGKKLFDMAKDNDEWFAELLTIDDCEHISQQAIQDEKDAGMPEEMILQEFYCSFAGYQTGSFYASQLARAEKEGRIGEVPWQPRKPVDTYFDLGVRGMSVWMVQQDGFKHNVIDYYESSDTSLVDTISFLKGDKPYHWRHHYYPHDINTREISSGIKRHDVVSDLGWAGYTVGKIPVMDGIEATQVAIHTCYFDKIRCERGLECLSNYRREWDEKHHTFKDTPLHDWASHGADAFRMFGVMLKDHEIQPDDWLKHQHRKPKVKRSLHQ